MIIQRPVEVKSVKDAKKWVLVFGRRKTGKTFLIENFIKYDEYFFVKIGRSILTKKGDSINYETFIQIFKRALEENKTIVVDEFHRLGQDFFDFVHFMKKSGKLILVSSTLFLSKKLISAKSPLLGLFNEVQIGLIQLNDSIKALKKSNLPKKELLELAVLLKEPIAVDFFEPQGSARSIFSKLVLGVAKAIPALTGEVFSEEGREISGIYEGILRAVAFGKNSSGEISSYLFSKRLIKKDDPSIIQQHLHNLSSFGIIRRIKIFNKKRFAYKLVSPLSRIYFYADEKYNFSERRLSEKELEDIIDELMPRIIEDAVREAVAQKHGLIESIFEEKGIEIDGYLLKFKKPQIVLEVKWKHLKKKEIAEIEEKLKKTKVSKKILFVPDKTKISSKLTLMDAGDLLH